MVFLGAASRRGLFGAPLLYDTPGIGNGLPLPGPIAGYGGGTFNTDGSQATPSQRGASMDDRPVMSAPRQPTSAPITAPGENALMYRGQGETDPAGPSPLARANAVLGGQAAPRQGPAPWDRPSGWGSRLSDLSTRLMAAQAFMDGDYRTGASVLSDLRQSNLATEQRQKLGQAMRGLGYSDDQIMVALSDPDSLGKNFNERFGTRVVAPGSSIVMGTPGGQQRAYQQPNTFEAYATAQGLRPGTPEYNTAMQDYILRSNGPTAFGFDEALDTSRTDNDLRLEGARQSGRMDLEAARQRNRLGLESERQQNRVTTRSTPTYRDLNPRTSPRQAKVPTATDAKGNTIFFRDGKWVDGQGRPVG